MSETQYIFPLYLPENFHDEDFLPAPCNEQAYQWVTSDMAVRAIEQRLFTIYGPVASGKSHLAHIWQKKTNALVVTPDLLSQDITEDLINHHDCFIIEDYDQIVVNDNGTLEEKLFHFFNALKSGRKHLMMTGVLPPAQVSLNLPDLASRLRSMPAIALHSPDDTLLEAVLHKMFSDRQIRIDSDVIRYALPRMERSFHAARLLVDEADKLALKQQRTITVPLMRQALDALQT